MKTYKFIIIYFFSIQLISCSMIEYRNYKEFHEHEGNGKYEVTTILPKEYKIGDIELDKVKAELVMYAKKNPVKKEERESKRLKLSLIGKVIDEGITDAAPLKDGTLKGFDFYSNWIINGDTTRYRFKDPLTNEQKKNFDNWVVKFKELYNNASYVHIDISDYFLKVDNKWYIISDTLEERPFNFRKLFPPKEDQDIRMIELKDHTPDFSRKAFQRDTSLWTYHGYEEADREEGIGLNPINFSAGWHYLQLKMPDSEPLKIKRYGSMGANLHTYIIPKEYGGREDVVFIVQEPSSLYPNREHGGMYVVRPREMGENTGSSP